MMQSHLKVLLILLFVSEITGGVDHS